MMEVENGYIWKVISIGDTPIFIHFPLPWLWETCILLNFLDTVWIFQDLPTSDFFLENLDIWKAGLPISFRWLLLRSWVPPLMEMLYMEVGQAWGWRCIFNSHQLIGLLLCVRATIHYYFFIFILIRSCFSLFVWSFMLLVSFMFSSLLIDLIGICSIERVEVDCNKPFIWVFSPMHSLLSGSLCFANAFLFVYQKLLWKNIESE